MYEINNLKWGTICIYIYIYIYASVCGDILFVLRKMYWPNYSTNEHKDENNRNKLRNI